MLMENVVNPPSLSPGTVSRNLPQVGSGYTSPQMWSLKEGDVDEEFVGKYDLPANKPKALCYTHRAFFNT
jgi:hypothetical protein